MIDDSWKSTGVSLKCMISSQAFFVKAMGKGNKALIWLQDTVDFCVLVILKHQGTSAPIIDHTSKCF